ncbi:MAG: DUF4139 domain-containing protein [Candidatus Marinimicrobia bacterium]|nr:DUF4139 domain-containing protein [Candidatus Neomarinimicrobiota bacterium]
MSSIPKKILLLTLPLLLGASEIKETHITVYNHNLGLVQQVMNVEINQGHDLFKIEGISAQVDPTTVHLSFPQEKSKIQVLEQNYLYDLVNSDKIFQKYIGEKITCFTIGGHAFTADLLSMEGNNLIVRNSDGGIRIINRKEIFDYNFPELPGGLILKPTLQWQLKSGFAGETDAKLSYLTSGMSWHAEYILILDQKDEKGSLSSWVSLENHSGASFIEANLKLIAGEINRAAPQLPQMPRVEKSMAFAAMADEAVNFEEREIMDYHLYELQRKVDLKDKEIKQVSMFDDLYCRVDKKYIFSNYNYADSDRPLDVWINISNRKENNLGLPLPMGIVRIFKEDTDQTLQMVGEDNIRHTSKNDTLKLTVGKAFDVKGERRIMDRKQFNRSEEVRVRLKIRNSKDEKIAVIAKEMHSNDWEVLNSTDSYKKISNAELQFAFDLGPNSEKVIEYTFRRNW